MLTMLTSALPHTMLKNNCSANGLLTLVSRVAEKSLKSVSILQILHRNANS
jgi:hypothetical protein